MRESGGKPSKRLRFYYNLTYDIATDFKKWATYSKTDILVRDIYHLTSNLDWRVAARTAFTGTCVPVTEGQRCADSFLIRQFRITAILVATALVDDENLRNCMGWPVRRTGWRTVQEWIHRHTDSCYDPRAALRP